MELLKWQQPAFCVVHGVYLPSKDPGHFHCPTWPVVHPWFWLLLLCYVKLPSKKGTQSAGWTVQAKLQLYLWLGLSKHKKELLTGLPAGYEDILQLQKACQQQCSPPPAIIYTGECPSYRWVLLVTWPWQDFLIRLERAPWFSVFPFKDLCDRRPYLVQHQLCLKWAGNQAIILGQWYSAKFYEGPTFSMTGAQGPGAKFFLVKTVYFYFALTAA